MNSAEKALTVLKRLADPPFEFGVTELAMENNITKGGMHGLLASLIATGFVIQNPVSKKYMLGPVNFRLGTVYGQRKGIHEVAGQIVEDLARSTKYTIVLGLLEGEHAVLAHMVKGEKETLYLGWIGQKLPLHAGVIGKILVAYLEPEEIRKIFYRGNLEKFTPDTPTDPEKLIAQCEIIKNQGFMSSTGERVSDVFAISVPVFDKNGLPWVSLSMVAPLNDYSEEKRNDWVRLLANAAKNIEDKLSFRS
ncbi:DNA-binding transcriptional regulator KdgR [Synergistales bacterium]|nr:DNA-binding transcriptional regulator KdgR [Synergistales bacterium]